MHLLGSLLLLLLLLGIGIILLRGSLLHRCGGLLDLLLLLLDGDEEADHLLGLDAVVLINLELAEDVVNLGLGHLVSPGHEGVLEHLGVDLAVHVVSLEGLDDEVIGVVAVSGHLLLEHLDHVVVGAGAPTSPSRLSSSDSDMSTPTLSKAPRRSFLSRVPSLLMSINLKQSLYIWSCSSEKPPSFWPLPMVLVCVNFR